MPNFHLAPHTFEIRPSATTLSPVQRPDELMIDWGNLPPGSTASIYLPAVAAADVLALAALMYTTRTFTIADAHTLACTVGGTTYVPIPTGGAANFAGLFTITLPTGLQSGQQFDVVVRQISSTNPRADDVRVLARRYVRGSFKISLPVGNAAALLLPEEQTLSIMRWILRSLPPTNRWYPVLLRYVEQITLRVIWFGGHPHEVPTTPTGQWPRLGGGDHGHGGGEQAGCTGKIDGIVYDRFGDFEAFILVTLEGERRRFESREPAMLKLVHGAWEHRTLLTVVVDSHHPDRAFEIILHGPPPAPHP